MELGDVLELKFMNETERLFELRLKPLLENVKVGHAAVSWSMTMIENGRKMSELDRFVVWKANFNGIYQAANEIH